MRRTVQGTARAASESAALGIVPAWLVLCSHKLAVTGRIDAVQLLQRMWRFRPISEIIALLLLRCDANDFGSVYVTDSSRNIVAPPFE